MELANRWVAQSEDAGAWPSVYAITQEVPGDAFIGPNGFGQMRGYPTMVDRSNRAKNMDVAKRLWERSEELTGISYNF